MVEKWWGCGGAVVETCGRCVVERSGREMVEEWCGFVGGVDMEQKQGRRVTGVGRTEARFRNARRFPLGMDDTRSQISPPY